MSIATRTGDDGTTGLLFGQRVPKSHPQIEAVGAFDELNAAIGMAKALSKNEASVKRLEGIQRKLVALMGELACAEADVERYALSKFDKLGDFDLAEIDSAISDLEGMNLRFDGWATPGATLEGAALDVARTTARRAERRLVALPSQGRSVRPVVGRYVNRVADLLWLMARQAEKPSKS
jgi:cob(I)alamin adenosyltransferase